MSQQRLYNTYWLHTEDMICIETDGYVGVTSKMAIRQQSHRRRFNHYDFVVTILFEGSRDECLALEERLRPEPLIGWNIAKGGGKTSGLPHTDEINRLISLKAKMRAATPEGRETMRRNALAAGSGKAHWRYGKPLSDEIKAKVAAAHVGLRRSEEARLKQSKSMLEKTKDQTYQENMRKRSLKAAGQKHQGHAEFMRQRWQDPTYAKEMRAMSANQKQSVSTKQKRKETMKLRYQNREFLEKMRASWKLGGLKRRITEHAVEE